MKRIILVGYGGHAKSIADCIERQKKYHIIGYTDVHKTESPYSYLGNDSNLERYYKEGITNAVICQGYLGKGDLRERLYQMLKGIGYELPIISDPSSIVSSSAKIGEGTFIGKAAVINSDVKIGKMCIINTKAVIEHECSIGDYSHVAVGAVLCGNVKLGQACFVGANTTVVQNLNIVDNTFIGAGKLIKRNVE